MARYFSGQRLREARTASGLSPERLALAVGRSAFSIRDYELGRVQPPVNVLAAIADALGRPVDDFIDEQAAA